ncbi:MAG TPA: RluA family pseudouridine synthase [Gemmatimonadaceae bacterium]|nr:RluA family pseudouridine synthase [Gemmatimonadaceae bacterium]
MGALGRGAISRSRRDRSAGVGYPDGELALSDIREIPVEADSNVRLDLFVAQKAGLSRTQAATLIAQGHVLVDGRLEKASFRTELGQTIRVEIPTPEKRALLGEDLPVSVVYEDESLLVVDKAAGMVVHPAPGNWTGTLVNALLGRGGALSGAGEPERAGMVHRLDKETSGLLVVAKTDRAHRLLSAAIADRRVVRRYAAMTWGHLASDTLTIDKPIARDPRDRKRMAIVNKGRPAKTDVIRLARFDAGDLLRAHLHSGRTHQIRVHLASIGHPVMGDDVYGGGGGRRVAGLPPKRHFLHAAWLAFKHPVTGEPLDFRSPLPEDLAHALTVLSGEHALPAGADHLAAFGFYE